MPYILLIFSLLLVSCGHHRDVRPSSDGIHRVQVTSEDEEQGQRDALAQARHFCEETYKKTAGIKTEKTFYSGSMDEENYRATKMASKVLKQGGSSAWVFGGKKESNAGQVAMGTGSVLDSAAGKGYTTQMTFECI